MVGPNSAILGVRTATIHSGYMCGVQRVKPVPGLPVGARSEGPRRPVHSERPRHGHVCTRRPRQALCPLLQNCKVFGKGQVLPGCSHTEGQGSSAEANRWPFPKEPALFPVQCPHWGCAWTAQQLSRTGKDEV